METNWNQLIERYLNGELSAEGKLAFEQQLKENPELQKELDLHQLTQNLIKRAAIRNMVQQSGKSYHFRKTLTTAGIIVLIVAIAALILFLKTSGGTASEANQKEQIEQSLLEEMNKELAFENVDPQYFKFTGLDDIFLSESGILLSITNQSFLLNGKPYKGEAVVQWQEAQTGADIVKAGLSTTSGDQLLETQGMFSLNAFTPDGRKLELSEKGVYVQVPVDELKKDMKLFNGVKGKDGRIDWQTPEELERLPKLKSMKNMDLFPPKYEPKLNELKWFTDKAKRDSLYLSFDETMSSDTTIEQIKEPVNLFNSLPFNQNTPKSKYPESQGTSLIGMSALSAIQKQPPSYQVDATRSLGAQTAQQGIDYPNDKVHWDFSLRKPHIPPSKVLAIWDKKFDNTILATQDFEDRMKFIHNTCDERVFDMYAKNLNEPLWKLDERAVKIGYKEFQQFADQRVGSLKLDDVHQQNLQKFYDKAIEEIRSKGKDAMLAALKKEQDWDIDMNEERDQEVYRRGFRNATNDEEEADYNLKYLSKQLGTTLGFALTSETFPSHYPKYKGPIPKNRKAKISNLPIVVNIDRLTKELLSSRQTVTVNMMDKSKSTKLVYSPFAIKVDSPKKYDRLYFYLLPNALNSFERLDFTNGDLSYPLNGAFGYDAVIVGINEDGYFLHEIKNLKPINNGTVKLSLVSEAEFNRRVNAMNSGRNVHRPLDIQSEINWLFKEKANYKVQRQRRENAAFRAVIRPTIYSCEKNMDNPESPIVSSGQNENFIGNSADIFPAPQIPASFPGGREAMLQFINQQLKFPQNALNNGINGKVILKFFISKTGKVSNVIVTKPLAGCPECEQEAKRIVENMPDWIPAQTNNKNVDSYFFLPISFSAR